MSESIFREGGPLNIRKTGSDKYIMNVSLPVDRDGRVARACLDKDCSPGYFKVKGGTGLTGKQESAFCPYCRNVADPGDFVTEEQLRYARDLALREAHEGIENMIKGALGLGSTGKKKMGGGLLSIEMSLKPGSKPIIRRPFEEEVRRDIICPYCGLDHSVYGLATWCADCGKDIFLTHVKAELAVVASMLGDVDRRREQLGTRVAAKDLENCLEDTVSIFEAVLRVLVRRYKCQNGSSAEEVDKLLNGIGNTFQNIRRSQEAFNLKVGLPLFYEMTVGEIDALAQIFEKRHPITHNLGVVDKKYIEKARSSEEEGKEVLISKEEISQVLELSTIAFVSLHNRMFMEKQ